MRTVPITADAAEGFRAKLSAKLRAAMSARDKETTSTLRTLLSAIDNASAISKEDALELSKSDVTEVPRRPVSQKEIAAILDAEIALRTESAKEFDRLGKANEAAELRRSVDVISALKNS